MIRARKLSLVHVKRTCLPIYGQTQATPYASFLDASLIDGADKDFKVFPGMVAVKTTGEQQKVIANATERPFGLFANFINGDLDEVGDSTEIGVWRGGPDATFEVIGDALDPASNFVAQNTTTGGVLIYGIPSGNDRGKLSLTDAGSQVAVARLVEAPSNTKIIVTLIL